MRLSYSYCNLGINDFIRKKSYSMIMFIIYINRIAIGIFASAHQTFYRYFHSNELKAMDFNIIEIVFKTSCILCEVSDMVPID